MEDRGCEHLPCTEDRRCERLLCTEDRRCEHLPCVKDRPCKCPPWTHSTPPLLLTAGRQSNQSDSKDFHRRSATNSLADLQASHLNSLGLSFRIYKMGEHDLALTS